MTHIHTQDYWNVYISMHTFLAANCMASCSNTLSPLIREETISSSCWKVYGWSLLSSPMRFWSN